MSIRAEVHHDNFSCVLYMVEINLIHEDIACAGQRRSRILYLPHIIIRGIMMGNGQYFCHKNPNNNLLREISKVF